MFGCFIKWSKFICKYLNNFFSGIRIFWNHATKSGPNAICIFVIDHIFFVVWKKWIISNFIIKYYKKSNYTDKVTYDNPICNK